ncbi:DUF3152 domain-containing protein [Actinacidiphila paucisporea]|uniref:DUF3152 domain-containing protein n=1 Tax=Actinacidiphila paucisporea TaxID=310782 RepID=A0A1M7FZ51_9ACTN|nr:DUF3152 domain-containing protein [Actinacidiphila paucisporea]SHM08929.1 Protein of unknown function [Actinacidiphila paucisporea]
MRSGRGGTVRGRAGRRRIFALCVVSAVGLAGAAAVSHMSSSTPGAGPDGRTGAVAGGAAGAKAGGTATSGSPDPGPQKGDGVFSTATVSGAAVGRGRIRRYKVQVERGTGVSADSAAREIERILADPRGWTADRHDAFQLVSGGSFDFEVKIASPATVDSICGAAGLHTHGEVNCDVGAQVVVNLKRWKTGSPEFPGPVGEYRALIINHEVGHRIGHGHEGCPGPGRPAPAMMQQIDGLHGCVANAWPYDSRGRYLGGPHVP